jgi:hypothetical protein
MLFLQQIILSQSVQEAAATIMETIQFFTPLHLPAVEKVERQLDFLEAPAEELEDRARFFIRAELAPQIKVMQAEI